MSRTRRVGTVVAVALGGTLAVGGGVLALQGDSSDPPAAGASAAGATTVPAPVTTATTTTTPPAGTGEGPAHERGLRHQPTVHDGTGGAAPTAADIAGAQEFLDAVRVGTARFADVDVAIAEGYFVPARAASEPGRRKHYMLRGGNPAVLDPTQPEGLVYWSDGNRTIFLGAVFVERDDANRVQPGGPITRWHDHSAETSNPDAVNMMHVWLYENAGDPFGITFVDSLPDGYRRGDPLPFA